MRIVDVLDQRSDAWKRWRAAGLGSSDAAAIMNCSPWKSPLDVWREKVHNEVDRRQTSSMRRGVELEPVVRSRYEAWTGRKADPLCVLHDEHDWLRASLDGWVEEQKAVVEIKCPNRDDHRLALSGSVPDKYTPQLDHQLLVTGGKAAHYVSYNPNFPSLERFTIVEYIPDPVKLKILHKAEEDFWQKVTSRIPPDCPA